MALWYYNYNNTDYLCHHGVKGMKWGIIKKYQPIGRNKKEYIIPNKKSGHRVRLEAKYLSKGYSDNDAEQMAAKRIRGEKFVAGFAASAVIAGASYVAYREIGKRYSNVMLETGKELHYINALGDTSSYDRRLYTTFEKSDMRKYKGLLAERLRKNAPNTTIYDSILRTTENIKAPSQKEARKLYSEFLKKPVSVKEYNIFNQDFADNFDSNPQIKGFVKLLKSKGYNSILDANDQFISGYNTKKPLILFNAAASTVKVGESVVSKQLSGRLYNVQMAALYAKGYGPIVGLGAAYISGATAKNTKTKYNAVNDYFANHPNANYSYGSVYNALKIKQNGRYIVDQSKLKEV